MNSLRHFLAVCALWMVTGAAAAHEGSTSYLAIDTRGGGPDFAGRFDVALIDLAWIMPLDVNADGALSWNEILAQRSAIAGTFSEGLSFSRGSKPCALAIREPWLADRLGLPYLSIDLAAVCESTGPIAIASSLLFEEDDTHRVLISVRTPTEVHTATLAPISRTWTEPGTASAWRTALAFAWQGMWHVWIGYDHLIFLLLLLLPAVVRHDGSNAGRGRAIALDLTRIVTAFTVAHSITLGLAATALVRLPERPIEVAIAMSLVIGGMMNLAPPLFRFRLPLAFGFGLVHGFGFANALAGVDTGGSPMLPVLAGFNIGVELANLAVVATVLPLLLWTGRFAWYAPRAMPAVSLVAAAVGAAWMMQRL